MGTGPQPAAYANSATGAHLALIIRTGALLVNICLNPLQWLFTATKLTSRCSFSLTILPSFIDYFVNASTNAIH